MFILLPVWYVFQKLHAMLASYQPLTRDHMIWMMRMVYAVWRPALASLAFIGQRLMERLAVATDVPIFISLILLPWLVRPAS